MGREILFSSNLTDYVQSLRKSKTTQIKSFFSPKYAEMASFWPKTGHKLEANGTRDSIQF